MRTRLIRTPCTVHVKPTTYVRRLRHRSVGADGGLFPALTPKDGTTLKLAVFGTRRRSPSRTRSQVEVVAGSLDPSSSGGVPRALVFRGTRDALEDLVCS